VKTDPDWQKVSATMDRYDQAVPRERPPRVPSPSPITAPPAPATTSPPPQRYPGISATPPGPVQPLIALLGTPVVLHLRYGELVRGVLVKLYNYELVVRMEPGREVVVMKHAIDWIEPGVPA
jgi:sRNA-binding regulator protein Hfq